MFFCRKLQREIDVLKAEIRELKDRYWECVDDINRIHAYLGVDVEVFPAKTILTKKGGPERG